ncbi:hypothetical protein MN608_06908 [Microdochium nivale]|nr:hypothetical protein MN608_06908 [Microdochium nivale]
MASGRSLTDVRRARTLSSNTERSDDAQMHKAAQRVGTAKSAREHQSGNTVERIYEQYALPNNGNSSPVSYDADAEGYVLSGPAEARSLAMQNRDGAASRFGFRVDDDIALGKKQATKSRPEHNVQSSNHTSLERRDFSCPQPRLRIEGTLSQPPNVALPICPGKFGNQVPSDIEGEVSTLEISSVTDSQYLLDAKPTIKVSRHEDPASQRPSRSPFDDDHAIAADNNDDWISETQSSLADTQTEDLFKYDNGRYRECLGSIRERAVSTALNGLTNTNLSSHDNGARHRLAEHDGDVSPLSDSSRWEDVAGSFFHPAAVESLTGEKAKTRDIRVVIKSRPHETNHETEALDEVEKLDSSVRKHSFFQDDTRRETNTGGDWVTMATSNFDRDSRTPEALFGGGVQATGSSIANVSDEQDRDYCRDPFGTRELVLQHPVAHGQSSSYHVRTSKDSKRPVLLPGNKELGFPLNSLRVLSGNRAAKQTNGANPFCPTAYRRADATDQFQFGSTEEQSLKYNFRDSLSEYTPALASNHATDGSDGVGTYDALPDVPTSNTVQDEAAYKDTTAPRSWWKYDGLEGNHAYHCPQATPGSCNGSQESAMSPDFQFGFELMPLGNARTQQRGQRDSGDTSASLESHHKEDKHRRTSSGFRPLAHIISPPMAARIRDASSNWHTSSTPRGPNSVVLVGYGVMSPHSDQALLLDEQAVVSTTTPMATHTMEARDERCWMKQRATANNNGQGRSPNNRGQYFESIEGYEISHWGQSRRECWFYMMVVLSILPFFALLVLMGVFDEGLTWFTQGEARTLSRRQKRVIQTMFIAECIVYTGCMASLIVYFVVKSQGL